jgi:hypothetical protein
MEQAANDSVDKSTRVVRRHTTARNCDYFDTKKMRSKFNMYRQSHGPEVVNLQEFFVFRFEGESRMVRAHLRKRGTSYTMPADSHGVSDGALSVPLPSFHVDDEHGAIEKALAELVAHIVSNYEVQICTGPLIILKALGETQAPGVDKFVHSFPLLSSPEDYVGGELPDELYKVCGDLHISLSLWDTFVSAMDAKSGGCCCQ